MSGLKKKLSVSVDATVAEEVKCYASDKGMKLSHAVEKLLDEALAAEAGLPAEAAATSLADIEKLEGLMEETLSSTLATFAATAYIVNALHVNDAYAFPLFKKMNLSEVSDYFQDAGSHMATNGRNLPAALAAVAEPRSTSYAHNLHFKAGTFTKGRGEFVDYYLEQAAKTNLARRRRKTHQENKKKRADHS